MKNIIFFLSILLLTAFQSTAQIFENGIPYGFDKTYNIDYTQLPIVDVSKLKAEDAFSDQYKSIPWRFGENIAVNYNIKSLGKSFQIEDGSIWFFGIASQDALSLNLRFGKYKVPDGAKLFIYSPNHKALLGAFTSLNNQLDNIFATTLIMSDSIIIEYYEPKNSSFEGELVIDRITHGYRNAFDYAKNLGSSGSCNINVACPEADGWDNEIRSVCMLLTGGNAFCSASIVNNTAQNGIPYVLTANHCSSGNDFSSWIFWFNWQSTTCQNPSTSPSYNSISGSVLKARNEASDFCLVQMNTQPTADFGVYYAGWDKSLNNPTSQVGIHHPSGDVKKISFDFEAATPTAWGSPAAEVWEIGSWNLGTTEGGSSGSPLFNQNHNIIGQLYGGEASCSNTTKSDNFGRFNVSWETGTTPATRLKDWLDPANLNPEALNGNDFNTPQYTLDAAAYSILSPSIGVYCSNIIEPAITIKNNGADVITSLTIKYRIDNNPTQTYDWTGSMNYLASRTINLPSINVTQAAHTFSFIVTAPNGGNDLNSTNDSASVSFVSTIGKEVTFFLKTDFYPNETSWAIKDIDNNIVFSQNSFQAGTEYTNNYCLPEGCYDFIIYDSGNNGLSGIYGFLTGNYELSYQGQIIAKGQNDFGSEDSVRFCTDTLISYLQIASLDKLISLYPNPNNGSLFINVPFNNYKIRIFDMQGRVIYNEEIFNNITNIILPVNIEGIYFAEITTPNNIFKRTIAIIR